jgi:ribosomal protein L21E
MMGHWKYIDFAFESCEFMEKQIPYYMYWGLAGYNQEHLTRAWEVVVEGFSKKKIIIFSPDNYNMYRYTCI